MKEKFWKKESKEEEWEEEEENWEEEEGLGKSKNILMRYGDPRIISNISSAKWTIIHRLKKKE